MDLCFGAKDAIMTVEVVKMKKLGTCIFVGLVLSTLSIVTWTHVVARALPSCVAICDAQGNAYGAGVIVAKNYVVTAKHVTAYFNDTGMTLYIRLANGKLVKVTKVIPLAQDAKDAFWVDASLLKVDTGTMPPAKCGNSNTLQIGQPVFAVGSSYGLEQSVTIGTISALHRDFTIEDTIYTDTIQTSGLIYPGNSGGALFDQYGHVIGINVAGIGDSGGIGFSIPINQVVRACKRNGLRLTQ
jgi:S1-C subfamily serine protease